VELSSHRHKCPSDTLVKIEIMAKIGYFQKILAPSQIKAETSVGS